MVLWQKAISCSVYIVIDVKTFTLPFMFYLFSHFLSFLVHTQELVGLVKELQGEISSLKGTDHTRRFSRLRDKLKGYCQAIDFNDIVALKNLRATLDEARLSKAEDMAKLSALWDRLAFAKQASPNINLRATIFECLVSKAKCEADKLVRPYEQHSTTRQSVQYRGERFWSSHGFRCDATDRRRGASGDKYFTCGEVGHFAHDCHNRRKQPHPKKPRTEWKIKLIALSPETLCLHY